MLKKKQIIETRPVYEFRPIPGDFRGDVRRYAEGEWLPDDGEHDLAFLGRGDTFAPICLYVEHPYQRNITAGWLTDDWRIAQRAHPRGNPWHYALRDGETEWGGDWGRERNLNYQAGQCGMSKMAGEHGCANGRHVDLSRPDDRYVAAGLVRDRETKGIFTFPERLVCMYCETRFEQSTGEPQ